MLSPAQNKVKDLGALAVSGYLLALMLYGMWSMANHIHWVVPFFLVGLAVVSQKTWLVALNMLAATVLAVYGLMHAQHLHWFKATLLVLLPLVVTHFGVAFIMWKLSQRNVQAQLPEV